MQSAPGLHDFASSSDWFIALHVRRVSCDRPDAIRALVYVLKRLLVKRCLLVRRFLIIRKKCNVIPRTCYATETQYVKLKIVTFSFQACLTLSVLP